jgi:hypothetical protein
MSRRKKGDCCPVLSQLQILFWIISVIYLIHLILIIVFSLKFPQTFDIMLFHGIINVPGLIQLICGGIFITQGFLSLRSLGSDPKAKRFRAWMDWTEYSAVTWPLTTATTLAGCVMFRWVVDIDGKFEPVLTDHRWDTNAGVLFVGLYARWSSFTETTGVDGSNFPFKLIQGIGKYWYVSAAVLTLLPLILILSMIQYQRKYFNDVILDHSL